MRFLIPKKFNDKNHLMQKELKNNNSINILYLVQMKNNFEEDEK